MRAGHISIGLLWHSIDSGNLGVEALTVGNIALVRQAARELGLTPRFCVLGFVDVGATRYVNDADVDFIAMNPRAMLPGGLYWRTISNLDCILDIGAGDSFTDIYSRKRFAYLWLSKFLALVNRTPLLLSPQTIGPFSRQPESMLSAWAMVHSRVVMVRDPLSYQVAVSMAPKARVVQAVDVAFALPFERRTKRADQLLEVGLNVSGLLFNAGYSGANEFGLQVDYASYTRKLIAALLSRPNVSVTLIAHVHSVLRERDDDRTVAAQLSKEFPGLDLAPDFASPSEAKSYISGFDFLVAGRMHACIAAFSSGVPVVPVAYSRKFSGLFEGVLKYPHIVPVRGMDTDTAVAFTLEKLDERESLESDIRRGSADVEGLLGRYRDELIQLFSGLKQE